jgi:hypothetical protein
MAETIGSESTPTVPATPEILQPVGELTGRARSLANLKLGQFNKEHRPSSPSHGKRDDGIFRWAADICSPEALAAKMKEAFPTVRKKKLTNKEALALRLALDGMSGDVDASKEFFNRLYGKSRESVDMTTLGEKISQNIFNLVDPSQKATVETIQREADNL